MYTQPIDSVNKRAQIIVKDSMAGISILPELASGDINDFLSSLDIRVELVRKSQPNAVLYSMSYIKFINLVGSLGKRFGSNLLIPFAINGNLILSGDAYLQIDLNWTFSGLRGLKVVNNTVAKSTNVPLALKQIVIDGDVEVDTEHYDSVFIDDGIQKVETFVDGLLSTLADNPNLTGGELSLIGSGVGLNRLDNSVRKLSNSNNVVLTGNCGCDGVVKRQKIELNYPYLSYMSAFNSIYVILKTEPNQKIKFSGSSTIYLIQS
ncbi:hypothetical protein [Kaistella sp.]|uniref:hypothetical protein n=1 Tax=Kaistella sp. TaxID=2782235 RepID=UPI003C569751